MGLRVGEGLWVGWGAIKDGMGWDYALEWDYGFVGAGLCFGWGLWVGRGGIKNGLGWDYGLLGVGLCSMVTTGLRADCSGIMYWFQWD